MWFVEVIDTGDNFVTRYIPVSGNITQGEALAAARASGLESHERLGTVAGRHFFEGQGVQTLPPDSAAITYNPAGGNGGNGGNGGFDPSDTTTPTEEFSFRPGFEAGLRQSGIDVTGGGGVRGALANRAYDPLLSRATISAALNPLGGDYDPEATQESLLGTDLTFQNYLKNQAAANSLFGRGGAQSARGLFEQARELSGDPLTALKALGEGRGISGQFLKPATIAQGATLANVAREAGRQRFGSFSRFLPSAQDLTQTYLSYAPENQPAETRQSFADFLNQRIFG